jgi:hypothetical protein
MIARKWVGGVAALVSLASLAGAASRAHSQSPAAQSPNVYEDDRISVAIPDGWTLSKPTGVFTTVAGVSSTQIVPGALLTKGKYKLFLLTHHGQASGVQGGRFGEISDYVSPWLDANSTCASYIHPAQTKITAKLSRVDNFYDTAHPDVQFTAPKRPRKCGAPSAPGVFWYGSYFQQTCPALANSPEDTDCGGYFLYFPDLEGKRATEMDASTEMTFSLTYDTTNPTTVPRQGDASLQQMLDEASAIVKSIIYK